MNLRDIRKDYIQSAIQDGDFPLDPMNWFRQWLNEAMESGEPEPTAMVLSSVSSEMRPSSRVVLLKSVDEHGFVFFSNYLSRKGIQLNGNHFAALTFFWPLTERQVRIEGVVGKTDAEESDNYFYSRPIESRINAVISPQSTTIESRSYLEMEREKLLFSESNENILRPEHWGGYRLIPDRIEFWQGRPGRLHDRIQYLLKGDLWEINRLAP
ncbi:MAG: pyridoxamine 5'-phosphate oxidase [Bacteroidales bacterium]